MRALMTMIGLGAILAAAPAVAADPTTNSTTAKSTVAGSGKESTYCIRSEPLAGSRIATVACKTKAEWAKEGITIEKSVKNVR